MFVAKGTHYKTFMSDWANTRFQIQSKSLCTPLLRKTDIIVMFYCQLDFSWLLHNSVYFCLFLAVLQTTVFYTSFSSFISFFSFFFRFLPYSIFCYVKKNFEKYRNKMIYTNTFFYFTDATHALIYIIMYTHVNNYIL